MTILPDVLAYDLDIVFCGTAAGTASARAEAYYAGPGNAFWPTLFKVGLIPVPLRPQDFARVTEWHLGLTDLAKHVSGGDSMLDRRHFDVARLRESMAEYRPHWVAFTSKRAAAEFVGHPVGYGLLAEIICVTGLFVLPSPSGAARGHWNEAYWRDLALLRGARPADAGRKSAVAGSIPPPSLRL